LVTLISFPMFIAASVAILFFLFFILFLNFFKHAELATNTMTIFLLLVLANLIYTVSFGILMNAKKNLALISIINRITLISATFLVVLFFHLITKLFSFRTRNTLITFYIGSLLFGVLLAFDIPMGLSNTLVETNNGYLTLHKGILAKLWGVNLLFLLVYTNIFLLKNFLTTSIKKEKTRKTILLLLSFSIFWTIGGVIDALTAIHIIKIPPVSWISSLSIVFTAAIILLNSFENMNNKADSLYNELIHDKLTGCYSKTFFDIEFKNVLDNLKRKEGNYLLMIFDVDDFKNINDTYGHLNGDLVLKSLVNIIHEELRAVDILARFGGDEFLILLEISPPSIAIINMVKRIQARINQTNFILNTQEVQITCSFGGVYINQKTVQNNLNQDDLFVLADEALYESKRAGKNRFIIK